MAGYYKNQSRHMGMLYGNMGLLIQDLLDDLKRPGTQTIIIVVVATIVSFGCFHFARWLDHDDEPH
jgi:hypothetical protein